MQPLLQGDASVHIFRLLYSRVQVTPRPMLRVLPQDWRKFIPCVLFTNSWLNCFLTVNRFSKTVQCTWIPANTSSLVLNFYLNSLDNNKEALNTAINYKDSNAELCYLAVSPTAQHQLYNTLLAEVPGVARVIFKTLFKKIRIYKPKIRFFFRILKKKNFFSLCYPRGTQGFTQREL